MTDLPMLRPQEVLRAIERLGFAEARQSGSHVILKHADGRWAPVPLHPARDIEPRLLRSILAELGVSADDFLAAHRR